MRNAYAKMAVEQARLFLDRSYTAEAEQAYRIANEISPGSPEAVFSYVQLLIKQNRFQEATSVAANAAQLDPENAQMRSLLENLQRAMASRQKAKKK